MLGDIVIYKQASANGGRGSQSVFVAPSAGLIQPGEPVFIIAGATSVIPNSANNLITVASPFVSFATTGTGLLGVAETISTNTSAASGSVDFLPVTSQTVYLINAKVSATFNTQAKYDALVGARVLLDYTSGVYTILASDSALNGCIIRPLDIYKFPGKVAFSFRDGISALN